MNRLSFYLRKLSIGLVCLFVFYLPAEATNLASAEAEKFLPDRLGEFRALPSAVSPDVKGTEKYGATSSAARYYRAKNGDVLMATIIRTRSDSCAYSLLTNYYLGNEYFRTPLDLRFGEIGNAFILHDQDLHFYQASTVVRINPIHEGNPAVDNTLALGRQLSGLLEKSDEDVPVLAKHLPDWEKVKAHAAYFVTNPGQFGDGPAPVLDAVSFDGGAEAVTARYSAGRLLIVEFTTPQLAGDNDRRIIERIHQLWAEGKPAPTAYRRVGNYSVLVFNAPDAQTANQLINQVKYEQVVHWLGDNPNWLREAERQYTETTLGVFVSVLKASGFAAVLCFGVGGVIGALLFNRRRAQQAAVQAYSDAGGMMRLNLDEMTAQTNPRKLIGPGVTDKP